MTQSSGGLFPLRVLAVAGVYFGATKLEAFAGRGKADYYSHDLEDLIAVADRRTEPAREIELAAKDVRAYIASETEKLLGTPAFLDCVTRLSAPRCCQPRRNNNFYRSE